MHHRRCSHALQVMRMEDLADKSAEEVAQIWLAVRTTSLSTSGLLGQHKPCHELLLPRCLFMPKAADSLTVAHRGLPCRCSDMSDLKLTRCVVVCTLLFMGPQYHGDPQATPSGEPPANPPAGNKQRVGMVLSAAEWSIMQENAKKRWVRSQLGTMVSSSVFVRVSAAVARELLQPDTRSQLLHSTRSVAETCLCCRALLLGNYIPVLLPLQFCAIM